MQDESEGEEMALTKTELREIAKKRRDLHTNVGNASERFFDDQYEEDMIGIAGEDAFAERYHFEIDMKPRPKGDKGIDFVTALGTVDVKTYRRPKNMLVKVSERWRGTAKILVLARYNKDDTIDLLGWCYAHEVERGPSNFGRGIMNYSKPYGEMKPMELFDSMLLDAETTGAIAR